MRKRTSCNKTKLLFTPHLPISTMNKHKQRSPRFSTTEIIQALSWMSSITYIQAIGILHRNFGTFCTEIFKQFAAIFYSTSIIVSLIKQFLGKVSVYVVAFHRYHSKKSSIKNQQSNWSRVVIVAGIIQLRTVRKQEHHVHIGTQFYILARSRNSIGKF